MRDLSGPSSLRLRPALDFDVETLAELMTRSFEGYLVSVTETPTGLAARLRYDSIDLALSRVAVLEGRPAGIAWVGVRGWSTRIAAMGVIPEARRRGVGRRLIEDAVASTRALGFRYMVLEVIEQNTPAVALYRGLGFSDRRRLVGYELAAEPVGLDDGSRRDAEAVAVADSREVGRLVAAEAKPDLPWQLAAETLATYGPSVCGYHLEGKAWALVQDSDAAVVLQALIVPRVHRRAGWGSRMLRALWLRHGKRPWRIPARVPESLGADSLTGVGYRRTELTQLEMYRSVYL